MTEETTQQVYWNPEEDAKADLSNDVTHSEPVVEAKPKRKRKAKAPPKKQPQIVFKDQKEMRHDVFKADLQNFLENTSFTRGMVNIVRREHTHIYHNINSQCKNLEYTNAIGGHFHKVELSEDENGNVVAKCGPPLRNGVKRLPNGSFKKTIEPVTWFDGMNNRNVVDDHTHELIYQHSEMIRVDSARKMRNAVAEREAMDNRSVYDDGSVRMEIR